MKFGKEKRKGGPVRCLPSKRWLFLACTLLTCVHGMNRAGKANVSLLMVRQTYKGVQISLRVHDSAKSEKTEFQHSGI